MSTTESEARPPGAQSWAEVHASEDFQRLRSRLRRFVFPMTALFLVWYLTYVVMADYAHDFMSIKLVGNINIGLISACRSSVPAFAITALSSATPTVSSTRSPTGSGRTWKGRVVTTLAQSIEGNNPVLNITIFALFVIVTLVVVFRASRNTKTASDYYAAGRSFSGPQNGTAIAGDYLSAASFLGIAGAIAVYGYDGFLYSIGFLVAWLVALLLVAELLRNTGKFTMGDVLAFRMRQRPVRAAAATSTMAVSFFYLLAQMAGAGALVSLLLGIDSDFGQAVVICVVGVVMILYVLVGDEGTTWVQIIKAALLIAARSR